MTKPRYDFYSEYIKKKFKKVQNKILYNSTQYYTGVQYIIHLESHFYGYRLSE